MNKSAVLALFAIALFAALSLLSGAPYLSAYLFGSLPVGNLLTALGLCAASAAAIGLSMPGTWLRAVSFVALLASALWLPVSAAMAGNLELSFSGSRGDTWLLISVGTLALVAIAVLWALASAGLAALSRRRDGR